MAKVKVTGLKNIQSNIRKFITKELRSKETREMVGNIVADEIQATRFKTAASSTQKTRKYLEKYNKTHPTYARSKINITFTGELLDDLRRNVKVSTTKGFFFIISQSDKLHKKYKGKKKSIGKKRAKYSEISDNLINKLDIQYLTLKKTSINELLGKLRKSVLNSFKNFK